MLLKVDGMNVAYRNMTAISDVTFNLDVGRIVALIGPNGAGKLTVLRVLCGTLNAYGGQITQGSILLDDESILGFRAGQLVSKGVTLVPDGRKLFKRLTVQENLEMGGFIVKKGEL